MDSSPNSSSDKKDGSCWHIKNLKIFRFYVHCMHANIKLINRNFLHLAEVGRKTLTQGYRKKFSIRSQICKRRNKKSALFQASVAVYEYMRSSLFWNVTQCRLALNYRLFGTIYRFHLQGTNSARRMPVTLTYAVTQGLNGQ